MINLPNHFKLIAEFITGSNLYGTSTPDSDVDTRGVFIPTMEYFFGYMKRTEQFEDKVNDIVYYDIRKFFHLAASNNPTILEFLFIPRRMVTHYTVEWQLIINNRDLFLSTKCKHTFSGYAHSQLRRIKGHRMWLLNPPKKKPERKDFDLPEERSLVTHDQMGAFNAIIANYLEQIGSHHELKEQLDELQETHNYKAIIENTENLNFDAIKVIAPLSDNLLEALAREKAYANSMRYWKQYQNWKATRHPARAKLEAEFGYDTKHAMHLYRLIEECRELLTKGTITLPRPDRGKLLAIKNGGYSYDSLLDYFERADKELADLYDNSVLPKKPDSNKLDALCTKLVWDHFSNEDTKGIIKDILGAFL